MPALGHVQHFAESEGGMWESEDSQLLDSRVTSGQGILGQLGLGGLLPHG